MAGWRISPLTLFYPTRSCRGKVIPLRQVRIRTLPGLRKVTLVRPRERHTCYDLAVVTNEVGDQPRFLQPVIRWAAFSGIALLVLRRLVYATFPGFLPSSAWRPGSWGAGLLLTAAFELLLVLLLLGVAVCMYFGLRSAHTRARDLWIDCSAAVGLYLTALFLL